MILDGLLQFTTTGGAGNGDAPTTGTQFSTNQLDLGLVGGLPADSTTTGGRDIGIGDDPAMKILVIVSVAFTGGTNLQVGIQGAPSNASNAPGTFTTMAFGPTVVEANLIVGARLLDIDMPRPAPTQAIPRFLQLTYVNSGTHTAGNVKGFLVLDRHDLPEQSNAVLGGYPAGITVAN